MPSIPLKRADVLDHRHVHAQDAPSDLRVVVETGVIETRADANFIICPSPSIACGG